MLSRTRNNDKPSWPHGAIEFPIRLLLSLLLSSNRNLLISLRCMASGSDGTEFPKPKLQTLDPKLKRAASSSERERKRERERERAREREREREREKERKRQRERARARKKEKEKEKEKKERERETGTETETETEKEKEKEKERASEGAWEGEREGGRRLGSPGAALVGPVFAV